MFEFYSEFSEMQQVAPASNGNFISIPITKVISLLRISGGAAVKISTHK
jgi:hypothetical protein